MPAMTKKVNCYETTFSHSLDEQLLDIQETSLKAGYDVTKIPDNGNFMLEIYKNNRLIFKAFVPEASSNYRIMPAPLLGKRKREEARRFLDENFTFVCSVNVILPKAERKQNQDSGYFRALAN